VSGQSDAFERFVATPHGLDFAHAAALYGLDYAQPATVDELRAALEAATITGHSKVIEVRTDRTENLDVHRRAADAGLEALRALSQTALAASPAA
jgi:2-succinyl-5-enolpyruvyl-6-hydroxy-3-cyclohexene-1-carboxylate synthase